MTEGVEVPRRIFRRTQEPLAADVSLIASEFLAGFQLVQQIDRPAVSIFGSARVAEIHSFPTRRSSDLKSVV